jgi:hypothetical protein
MHRMSLRNEINSFISSVFDIYRFCCCSLTPSVMLNRDWMLLMSLLAHINVTVKLLSINVLSFITILGLITVFLPNVVLEWLTLLLRIRDVPGSNLGPGDWLSWLRFFVGLLSPSSRIYYLKIRSRPLRTKILSTLPLFTCDLIIDSV